jgi:hypothetical protein
VVRAAVAHTQAVDHGATERAAALDDLPHMHRMLDPRAVSAYGETDSQTTKAPVILFIGFGFSHDRRLEVLVLVIFLLLVIIVVGISGRHLAVRHSEETPVN